jgi:hypothetical protein
MKQVMPLYRPASDCGVVLANTCMKSAYGAFVIHCLVPFSTHASPSQSAVVVMFGESEPTSGSVWANAVDFSAAITGSRYRSTWPPSAANRSGFGPSGPASM